MPAKSAVLPSAAEIIARLELKPHPEGGHYRETFRDGRLDATGRSLSTAIYFLLPASTFEKKGQADVV